MINLRWCQNHPIFPTVQIKSSTRRHEHIQTLHRILFHWSQSLRMNRTSEKTLMWVSPNSLWIEEGKRIKRLFVDRRNKINQSYHKANMNKMAPREVTLALRWVIGHVKWQKSEFRKSNVRKMLKEKIILKRWSKIYWNCTKCSWLNKKRSWSKLLMTTVRKRRMRVM